MTAQLIRSVFDFYISTHTLTWSVTCDTDSIKFLNYISTHTLTWSVTKLRHFMTVKTKISTHTLTWSVTRYAIGKIKEYIISTHTLTWSVTIHYKNMLLYSIYFNSHAHVERDSTLSHLTIF